MYLWTKIEDVKTQVLSKIVGLFKEAQGNNLHVLIAFFIGRADCNLTFLPRLSLWFAYTRLWMICLSCVLKWVCPSWRLSPLR